MFVTAISFDAISRLIDLIHIGVVGPHDYARFSYLDERECKNERIKKTNVDDYDEDDQVVENLNQKHQ
jgi:hypothetical protein